MKSKIIYQLSTEDIYNVAEEALGREPTKAELKFVEERIGDHISWFDIIEYLLSEFEDEPKEKKVVKH